MKPFLKWLGGKTRLIPQMEPFFPYDIQRYVEPFIGGGAVFLHLSQTRDLKSAVICDASRELTLAWRSVQGNPTGLCRALKGMAREYLSLPKEEREAYYYHMREEHNQGKGGPDRRAARVVFLNKTCYNGLFRHNAKGGFNSPFGKYESPSFFDKDNIEAVSKALSGVTIIQGDFTECEQFIKKDTFVYFDPPYRPLNATSSFTQFSGRGFDDADQERLAASFKRLDKRGAKLMLSNSDTPDGYFEALYAGFNIRRVQAGRSVNSDPGKRGKVSELLITNY